MVTLRAVSRYVNREQVYGAGEVFQVAEGMAAWLEADAPGVFVRVVQPESRAVERPAEDKMMADAPASKAAGRPRRKG